MPDLRDPRLLMTSPYESDGGTLVGCDPRTAEAAAILAAQDRPKSRGKALRAKCIDCAGGSAAEVRKCTALECALWPFRMGRSPFRPPRRIGKAPADEPDVDVEEEEDDEDPSPVFVNPFL